MVTLVCTQFADFKTSTLSITANADDNGTYPIGLLGRLKGICSSVSMSGSLKKDPA